MATLQIKKKSLRTWEHIDSQLGMFILSKFEFSTGTETFQVVEANGAKRRIYNISDIEVFDIGGAAETFGTVTQLSLRLEELKYPGFYRDGDFIFEVDPNRVIISDSSGNLEGADVAFYPDLTELSFVKGVSSNIQTQLNGKQSALGYTPVPESRTITINGVTQDLSANRTFTVIDRTVVCVQNRWTLAVADTYYRARADFSGFNADTLTVSASAANYAALTQANRSNAAFFYTANGDKKLNKIYFDISNTGPTITGFTLMVVACQRVASTSANTSTVNGIDLGEYVVSKPTNDLTGFYTITPNNVTIPDGYIVTYFLKRADGSTSEINCSAHFHFIDA